MMMKQLNIAFIGCSQIARTHLMALKEIPEANICGVWNRTPARMAEFADKYQVKTYPDYQAVLNDPMVDAVLITLAPGLHVDYALQAAAAGKHIILEKPMDIDVAKCFRLIEACRKNKLGLAVIYQNRYTVAARKVKEALDQGVLGKVFLADAYVKWYRSPEYYKSGQWRGTWEMEGGGALINQAIHTIDLVQWFMGGAVSVQGMIRTASHAIQTEDLGIAVVEYANGAIGVIEGSTAITPGYKERVELHGTKGSIILEGGNIKEWKVEGCREEEWVTPEKVSYGDTKSPAISYVNHKTQLEEIVRAFIEGRDPQVTGEEGVKSLQIVCGIYESSRTGQRIWLNGTK